MQIAILGLGDIARKAYLPLLGNRTGLDILLSSHSSASIEMIKQQYRISKSAQNLEEVIRNHPQAAFVLTPKETHFKIVRRLLEAEIDVFVEKPATLNSAETRQLAEIADQHGRMLMVGFNRRFAPLHIKAKELMIGLPVSVGLFQKNRSSSSSQSLLDQFTEDTIHQIDILRFYCGEGEVVSTAYQIQENKLVNAVSTVALENGGIALLATSLQAGGWNETYTIHGPNKSLFIDAFSRLRLKVSEEEKMWQETYASSWKTTLDGRGFTGQVDHFFECVEKRQQPQTSAWDSVKTQLLLEQMLAKADEH
jgi:virulence factor